MFCFLMWVLIIWVCSVCENVPSYTLDTPFYKDTVFELNLVNWREKNPTQDEVSAKCW